MEEEYERLNYRLRYDPETGKIYHRNPKHKKFLGVEAGSKHCCGYRQLVIDKKHYLAHRVAWFLTHKVWPEGDIDHIDGDRSNNRLSNIRQCSRTRNSQNAMSHKGNSKYKGVWNSGRKTNPFQAHIQVFGARKYLGSFERELEAALAYDKAALESFGAFARLNIIEGERFEKQY